MWPLQPEPAPKPEGAPRVEPSLRAEPRRGRSVRRPVSKNSIHWPGERRDAGGAFARSFTRGRAAGPQTIRRRSARRPGGRALAHPAGSRRRAGSNRAQLRAARRGLRCRPRRQLRLPTPRRLRPATKIFPRWRNGWRPRCGVPKSADKSGGESLATPPSPGPDRSRLGRPWRTSRRLPPRGWEPRCAARSAPTMSAPARSHRKQRASPPRAGMDEFAPAPSGAAVRRHPAPPVPDRRGPPDAAGAERRANRPRRDAGGCAASRDHRVPDMPARCHPTASRRRRNRSTTVSSRRWRAC